MDDDFGLTDNWQISRVHYVHLKICYVYFSFWNCLKPLTEKHQKALSIYCVRVRNKELKN